MPPRKTTDFGALFSALVEDVRLQVATSVDESLGELDRRLARLERRLDTLDPESSSPGAAPSKRACAVCGRASVARGLCSAHYQQWRYRSRKGRPTADAKAPVADELLDTPAISDDN